MYLHLHNSQFDAKNFGDTKNFRKKRQIRDFFRSLLPQFDLFLCFDVTDQGTNQSKQNMKPWPDLNCHIRTTNA